MNKFMLSLFTLLVLSGNSWAAILVMSPNGTYTTKTTLEAARTAADVANKTVVVTSALTQAQSNIVAAWPADRALKVEKGGMITISIGTTFTINGTFTAGLYQSLAGEGAYRFGVGSITKAHPQWWGVKGDGITDNTSAMQRTINDCVASKVGTLEFPSGVYIFNNITLPIASTGSALRFEGQGSWSWQGSGTPYMPAVFGTATEFKSSIAVPMFKTTIATSGYEFTNIYFNGNKIGTKGLEPLNYNLTPSEAHASYFTYNRCLFTGFTDTALQLRGGVCEVKFSHFTGNVNGVDMGSDGRFIGNHVIGNSGWGVKLRGGTEFAYNEVAWNAGKGIIIDSTDGGVISNASVTGGYIEANGDHQIYVKGNNGQVGIRITDAYISSLHPESGGNGIYMENVSNARISGVNFVGAAGVGAGSVYLKDCAHIQINDITSINSSKNVVRIESTSVAASNNIQINNVQASNYASATSLLDETYGIYVADNTFNVMANGVNFTDERGTHYARGVRFPTGAKGHSIRDYKLSTSIATPDVFGGAHWEQIDNSTGRNRSGIQRIDTIYLGASTVGLFSGTGSPEGVVTANPGSLYLNFSGGAATSLYVKQTGSSTNTGWIGK